jgi:hypothetical protein
MFFGIALERPALRDNWRRAKDFMPLLQIEGLDRP